MRYITKRVGISKIGRVQWSRSRGNELPLDDLQLAYNEMDTGVLSFISGIFKYLADNPYILWILFLLYIFIFVMSILFSGPKPGRNPFSAKHVKPVQELVSDQKIRDKVLKQSMFLF